jgi:MFS family permease
VPGVLLYLTYWFPAAYRARANGFFMIAQPLSIAFGSILSGYLMKLDGVLGLSGWRWLFILEGVPSIVLGVVTFFYLKDRPRDAAWLAPAERAAVEERPTKNIAAFIAYGRAARYETEFRFVDAVREYDAALKLDPSFTLAAMRRDEAAALAGLTTRRNALARASDMTVDRLNGVFTTPVGGGQSPGGITDPVFPALIVTIFITILTPR